MKTLTLSWNVPAHDGQNIIHRLQGVLTNGWGCEPFPLIPTLANNQVVALVGHGTIVPTFVAQFDFKDGLIFCVSCSDEGIARQLIFYVEGSLFQMRPGTVRLTPITTLVPVTA